jgi:predicted MPP superfamily phosphohydrolase
MPRIGWCTDIHLDWLERAQRQEFYKTLRDARLDSLLIGGDIGLADTVVNLLAEIAGGVKIPIYFVLGNHDYYGGSISTVRKRVRGLAAARRQLTYLTDGAVVLLSKNTALVGHDSWADARLGDFMGSEVVLNDYLLIEDLSVAGDLDELRSIDKPKLRAKLNALGDQAAREIRAPLLKALATRNEVFVLTHVPPFREACCHGGGISTGEFLPHFASKAFGEPLLEAAAAHPGRNITVLCGHTHGGGFVQLRPNLRVWTGSARYGSPVLQRVFEV